MKDFFTSFYFIAPLCIVAIALGIYIISKSTRNLIYTNLSQRSNKGVGYIYDILSTQYPSPKVLKDALIVPADILKDDPGIKPSSDIIFVNKCGVLLITVITDKGEFDNPKTGEWRYRFVDGDGKVQVQKKINPFDSTIPQIRIVSDILKKEGIYSKCIKRLVVYTQNKIRFTYNYSEIISIDKLISAIDSMNLKNELTPSEARVAFRAITKYSNSLKNN